MGIPPCPREDFVDTARRRGDLLLPGEQPADGRADEEWRRLPCPRIPRLSTMRSANPGERSTRSTIALLWTFA